MGRIVKTSLFRKFLVYMGCQYARTKGDHEIWRRSGLSRSIVFQTRPKEVAEHVLSSNLQTLGLTKNDFYRILEEMKTSGDGYLEYTEGEDEPGME